MLVQLAPGSPASAEGARDLSCGVTDMADVADGCVADGCCTVVQMAAEQHPDLRLALGDWSVAKSKGTEHPDWRLAEDLPVGRRGGVGLPLFGQGHLPRRVRLFRKPSP